MTAPLGNPSSLPEQPAGVGASVVRTVVPFLVSVLIGQAARIGLDLDEGGATQIVTAVVFALYYAGSRWVEANVSDQAGRILLSLGMVKAKPVYRRPTNLVG